MNLTLSPKTLTQISFGHFQSFKFVNSLKNQISLRRNLFLLILLCGMIPTLVYSQGGDCGSATPIVVNGACLNGTISDKTPNAPNYTGCGGTFRREGWYSFTLTGNMQVTITAIGNYNLAFQLISSSNNSCTGTLTQIDCVNGSNGAGAGGTATETLTVNLNAGTYYIKILNVGADQDLTLSSLCVTATLPAYCTPVSTYNSDYIADFSTTGGVTNISNNGTFGGITSSGYSDYTAQSVSQLPGQVINISTDFSGTSDTFGFNLWVDWNNDGDFVDAGENLLTSNGYLTGGTGSFTVPIGASVGNYRMRIRNDYSSANPTSCGTITYGEAEDYTLVVLSTTSCSGTPTSGTTVLTPSTGAPSSAFVATITGSSTGGGLSYQWQIADAPAGPYTDISGATGASANLTAVPLPGTTKYYRRTITCSGSGLSSVSAGVAFTTTSPTYCTPTTSSPGKTYIKSFKFVGTLNDPPLSANVTGGNGYANYTTLTPIAQQPDGKVMNIEAISDGTIKLGNSYGNGNWKAYVDWNGDGDFVDAGEQVYSLTTFVTNALTFGFVIPAGQTPGKYRFRIIVNNDSGSFSSCSSFTNGEVEDYSFEVVYNCPATVDAINIVATDGHRCGTGTVNLSASGTGTNYKWYTTLTGGSAIFTGSNYTTASLSTTTVYYVTAINGTCESAYRIPVTARIDPEPVVNITTPAPICGTGFSGVQLTSSGDQYVDTIVDEKFDSGLGLFTSSTLGAYTGVSGTWQNRPSPYIPTVPPYEGLAPALSSGYFGGNYAAIITDINRNQPLLNALTLTANRDLTNFQDLRLDFDLYYFSITNLASEGYLNVEFSLDGGGSWNILSTITTIQGNPNTWNKITIPIPGPYVSTQFKIRFLLYAYADNSGGGSWKESIATVDNIKIYGNKPITTGFVWSGPANTLYESTCTTLIGATKTNSICIKPSVTQIENDASWSITATANFANGCPATKTIVVQNDTKTWDSASSDWNSTNWRPGATAPTADKCVIIKKPVIIDAATNGLAKNLTIETGGKLNIFGSLKVTDWVKNNAAATDVVVESEGNLLQVNDGTSINTGNITAKKIINITNLRKQYNYLISPLEGQSLKTIYPGIDEVLYHNQTNNYFYNSTGAYIKGRGLAVKEPNTSGTGVPAGSPTVSATYTGYPTNGAFTFGMVNSAPTVLGTGTTARGYNLIGNPYPSNIDLTQLYSINGGNGGTLNSTFYFWDSSVNDIYVQQGSSYGGQSYGQFNAASGLGTPATGDFGSASLVKPTRFVKTGKAFMARSLAATTTLQFNNSIRTNTSAPLNSRGTAIEEDSGDHYWLSLVSPANIASTIAVGYLPNGDNGLARDDSFSMMGSDALYSIVENEKISINGRSPFDVNDVIPLGTVHFAAGNYQIVLKEKAGIFANGQHIYLKDNQTGIITNLSEGNYTFQTNAGESTGRFEIIYKPQTVLATDLTTKEELVVYQDRGDFVVKAQSKKITDLQVFDMNGRLLLKLEPQSTKAVIPAAMFINGVYVLKVNQGAKVTTKKVIR